MELLAIFPYLLDASFNSGVCSGDALVACAVRPSAQLRLGIIYLSNNLVIDCGCLFPWIYHKISNFIILSLR